MKVRVFFSKILIKYPYIPWLLGLLLPFLYFNFLLNFKKIFNQIKKKDTVYSFLLFFLFVQIFSVSLSIFYPFFSLGRLGAIGHNIMAYCFVFLGYILLFDDYIREYLKKNIIKMFYMMSLIIFVGAIWSYSIKAGSSIKTIPNLLGINHPFFNALLSFPAWHFMPDFPRTRVMSIYPNGAGINILLIHAIYMNFNYKRSRSFQILTFLVFILCIFITGSRSFLIFAIFLLIVYLINTKQKLWLLTLFIPIAILIATPLIDYLVSGRRGSNEMRSMIYVNSFKYMLETNPLFGLGLKPRIEELAGKYPVGSHSTPWGYLIKCGLLGGGMIIMFYLTIFLKYLTYLFKLVFSNHKLNPEYFYHFSSFVVILLASFFEDFDAFEIMPFYFGIVLWQFYRKKEYEQYQ